MHLSSVLVLVPHIVWHNKTQNYTRSWTLFEHRSFYAVYIHGVSHTNTLPYYPSIAQSISTSVPNTADIYATLTQHLFHRRQG